MAWVWSSPLLHIGRPSAECVSIIQRYVRCVMRYGNEWGVIQQAVDLCPQSPMAWLLQTDLFIAAEDAVAARKSLSRARDVIGSSPVEAELSPHLDSYCQAWSHWLDGDLMHSAQCFENVLLRMPHDAFALKRAQLLYFLGGSPHRMQAVGESSTVVAALTGTAFYHGMVAFALEQNGDSEGAELHGRLGTEILPDDAWSHHAVAHALYNKGKLNEGLDWLQSKSHLWVDLCSFMVTHNHFHIVLNCLDLGDFPRCFQHYDKYVWGVDKASMQDEMGALGLLLKLHLRMAIHDVATSFSKSSGESQEMLQACFIERVKSPTADILERLQDVMIYCVKKLEYHGDPFFDCLIAWGLAVSGREEEGSSFLLSSQRFVETQSDSRRADVETAWVNGMKALQYMATGAFLDASEAFSTFQASPRSTSALNTAALGNSAEQRDVLDEAFLVCLLSSGRLGEASTLIWNRVERRPGIPADMEALAVCSRLQGSPVEEWSGILSTAAKLQAMHESQK